MDLAVQRSQTRVSMEPVENLPTSLDTVPPRTLLTTLGGRPDIVPRGLDDTAALPLDEEARLPSSLLGSTQSDFDSQTVSRTVENETPFESVEEEPNPGSKRTLNDDDVWSLPPTFLHRNLFTKYLARRTRWECCSLTFLF